ncbi:hypothetical protein [Micromonospora sp. NPDC049679]|uniref:hypothetical protein n=1 Tax=Micromonospora sp. NPDC049679 TaxID=3155920 RepID=UPI0033DBD250
MAYPEPSRDGAESDPAQPRANWLDRRRQKVANEIARNRRGEYTVPTWVLALALALMVGGWIALIVLS